MKSKIRVGAGQLAVNKINAREEAVLNDSGMRCESVLFDFDEDGGAVGTLLCGKQLPAGAIIFDIFTDEITALTSGGSATFQLLAGATALSAALAFDTGFNGLDDQALAGAVEAIKLSAAAELQFAIGTAALTAGKVRFFVQFMLPND
jgi:hypothetical protein